MKCYAHPEAEAEGICTRCGKAVCQTCAVDVGGKIVCSQCLASAPAVGSGQESLTSRNPVAVASLVLAVLGLLGCACGGGIGGPLFGIPAAITGYLGRKQALEAGGDQDAVTFATIGLIGGTAEAVLGLIALLVGVAVMGINLLGSANY